MLGDIQQKIRARQYEFSRHALDQSILHDIRVSEVEEALLGRLRSLRTIQMTNMARAVYCWGSPYKAVSCMCCAAIRRVPCSR